MCIGSCSLDWDGRDRQSCGEALKENAKRTASPQTHETFSHDSFLLNFSCFLTTFCCCCRRAFSNSRELCESSLTTDFVIFRITWHFGQGEKIKSLKFLRYFTFLSDRVTDFTHAFVFFRALFVAALLERND